MRRTEVYRIMPWVGGINTSVDPGVLNSQELVQADGVQFSSTGARVKREALEYLDNDLEAPDFRSSSGTTRTLKWTSSILRSTVSPEERLVVGEKINVTGNSNYNASEVSVLTRTSVAQVVTIACVADSAGSLNNKYFLISAGDPGEDYYVWFNVNSAGTDPEVVGRTGVQVAIATGATAGTVATAVAAALDALADFVASAVSSTVTSTNALAGYSEDPGNGNSGVTTTVTTQGSYSITYTAETSVSESETAASGVEAARASAVIMFHDYWRYADGTNSQLAIYATDNFQLFKIDDNKRRVQIHGQEQTTTIVCGAASTLTTGDYFLINGANDENNAYVWYNKASGGGDPAVAGRTGIEVVVAGGATDAQVASATQAAIDASAHFSASVGTTTVTVVAATSGVTSVSVDFNTAFVIATTAYGATNPTTSVDRIRTNVFNERLKIYFTGTGNYPVFYNPETSAKYQLTGDNPATGFTAPDASFAFNHLGREWCDEKGDRDRLHFCETFDDSKWLGLGDSGALYVGFGDGDPEGITNAYVYKGFIVAAKKESRHRILGDSPENFQVEKISSGMGNEGPLSIPVDESDVVFLSRRGIHSQQATDTYGDTDAAYLSADIKPTFNSFEPSMLKFVQGNYIPELNSIALAITEDGEQTPMDVWLYNIENQVPGKERPGSWYRWPNISCSALSRRIDNSKHKLIFGTKAGRVIQAQKENDYADFGTTGIPFTVKTGTIYPGGDPQTMKRFLKISAIYRPRGNFSFALQAKIDNHETQAFAFNEISGLDILGETFILGTSLLGSANTLAPFTRSMDGVGRGVTLTVSQPTADEQVDIWGISIEWENLDLEQEVQ